MSKNNIVLITGVAGFIGMHTAMRFLKEGWDVLGIDNINDYYSKKLKRDRLQEIVSYSISTGRSFRFFENDINSDVWDSISSIEIEVVIHLAAQAGVRYSLENPRAYLHANILGFQSVLEFVESKNIAKFLYASSSSVYGKYSEQPFHENQPCNYPESYYAATKKANEQMAHAMFKSKGVSSIGLRFFTVYGPWGRPDMAPMLFADAALKGKKIKVFNYGMQKRDFTYITDIVEGIFLLINTHTFRSSDIFNIGFGKPSSLEHFIELIEKEIGIDIKKDYVEAQPGDVDETYASTLKLENLINYKPNTSLETGMRQFIRWHKNYYQ